MDVPVIDLSGVESQIANVSAKVDQLGSRVDHVDSKIDGLRDDLKQLRKDFLEMALEQQRHAALANAKTELLGIHQEWEKRFGNYTTVRNTMVGILQATDAALVRKATISTVSEELMISTPDYWLAPVLVALAAWINNNRDLAERAIQEAVKRDNEHTSLAMALICRRNGRTATCYEWLARYFSTQNAARIDADAMVYIDAYINGIFGADEKHLCDDYMVRWIEQVQNQTPEFEERQSESWAGYFKGYEPDMGGKYPALKAVAKEFDPINKYLGRIGAIENISDRFADLRSADIDSRTLAEQVDSHLMQLVNSDDPKERELRAREEYYEAVKAFEGDEARARECVKQNRNEKRRQTMNIVDQMTRAIRDQSGSVDLHQKKTAVKFLGGYINRGFDRYRQSKIPDFPQAVTIDFDGWTNRSATGEEGDELRGDFVRFINEQKQAEIAQLDATIKKESTTNTIVAAVCGVIALFTFFAVNPLIGIIFAMVAAVFAKKIFDSNKKRTEGVQAIEGKHNQRIQQGCNEIDLALSQWRDARSVAANGAELLKLDRVA